MTKRCFDGKFAIWFIVNAFEFDRIVRDNVSGVSDSSWACWLFVCSVWLSNDNFATWIGVFVDVYIFHNELSTAKLMVQSIDSSMMSQWLEAILLGYKYQINILFFNKKWVHWFFNIWIHHFFNPSMLTWQTYSYLLSNVISSLIHMKTFSYIFHC